MRHEMHLTAKSLKALALATPLMLAGGWAVNGLAGTTSVAAGIFLVGANQFAAAASTGWSRVLSPGALAVGYLFFAVRMFAILAAFAVAATIPGIHRGLLAGSFCASLVVTLSAACLSFARDSYVPRWRRA